MATVRKQKTLGQIAYEAESHARKVAYGPWEQIGSTFQQVYERMAAAVAKAVKRRGEAK